MDVIAPHFIAKLKATLVITFIAKLFAVILLMAYSISYQDFLLELPKKQPHPSKSSSGLLYSDYFEKGVPKVNVSLLVVVLSALEKYERRRMIRNTWWQDCKKHENVVCVFLMDSLEGQEKNHQIREEILQNKDIIISPVKKGLFFGHRLLFAMQWATSYFDFKYLIRSDEDVLLCIDHLLYRMNFLPRSYFLSGVLHCADEGIVYLDEGISTFSQDVVQLFLSQKPQDMYCHPFGDQTYSTWVQHLHMNASKLYHIETRIHHHPPASRVDKLKNITRICHKYIALHGVYGNDMISFWNRRLSETFPKTTGILKSDAACPFKPTYNWKKFTGVYGFEPKLCNDHKVWKGVEARTFFSRE